MSRLLVVGVRRRPGELPPRGLDLRLPLVSGSEVSPGLNTIKE